MRYRPTPETDAAVDDTALEDKNQVHTDWVTAFFSRKLERERDEAREALMKIEDRCVDCEDACDDIQKIRDIARSALGKNEQK